MTWEWVVLILGVLFIIFAAVIAYTFASRETYENREGNMFAPTVIRRSGLNLVLDDQEEREDAETIRTGN